MIPSRKSAYAKALIRAIWLIGLASLCVACTKKPAAVPAQRPVTTTAPLTIPVDMTVLPNGLRVLVHKDDTTPFVTVNLSVLAGSGHEQAGEAGAAYLLQYLLFQAGTGLKDPVMKVLEDAGADTAGGAVSSYVDYDRLTLTSTVPAHALDKVLWLESRRFQGFLDQLSDDVFERQRALLRDALVAAQEKPYGLQNDLLSRHVYPRGHPYAKPVTASPEDIALLTPAAVRAFYRRNLTPQNAVLVVSGHVDAKAALAEVNQFFAPLRPVNATTQIISDDSGAEPRKRIAHRSNAPAKQVFVWKGPGSTSPQLPALEMAGAILTGGKTSRLHDELVRQEKLATNVTANVQSARLGSEFIIEVAPVPGADPDRVGKVVARVIAQAAQQGFGEADVTAARAKAEFEFFRSIESSTGPSGKAARFARALLFEPLPGSVDDSFFTKQHQLITGQTATSIADAMRTYLLRDAALEIRFVPAEYRSTPALVADVPEADPNQSLPAVVPAFERKELPNGLDLIVFNRTQEGAASGVGIVDVELVIKTTDLFEADEASGTSMLTAKAVLAGTKARSAFQIENAVNSFGGSLSSDGSKFGARLTINGLRRHLDGMFELLADVAINPVFPDAELTAVRKIVSEKQARDYAQPNQAANMMFAKILFAGGHPGGTPVDGTAESISTLTPTNLKDHHQKYWLPNNAALIVSGPVTLEEAERLANKHFAFWSKKALEAVTLQELPGPDRLYAFLVHVPDMNDVMLRFGSVAPYRGHADEIPLQVLNQVLVARSKQSQAAELLATARFNAALVQNRYFGSWMQSAVSSPARAVAVMQAMRQNLAALPNDQANRTPGRDMAKELSKAQNELARSFLRSFETSALTNRMTSSLASSGIAPKRINTYLPDLYKLTPQELAQTAARYAGHNRQIILFMGDVSGIEQELLKRGFSDIVTLDRSGKFLKKSGS